MCAPCAKLFLSRQLSSPLWFRRAKPLTQGTLASSTAIVSGGASIGHLQPRGQALPNDDWRSRNAEHSGERLAKSLELADAFRPIAERHGTAAAAVGVAWAPAWPGVTEAIVGVRCPAQVNGWIEAVRLDLTSDDFAEIAAAVESTGADSGPLSPLRKREIRRA